jgi:hypothetical protein
MDWQIGGLAIAGALAAAAFERSPGGLRRAARVALGAALALAPFVAYFAASGALTIVFRQVIEASFFRGAVSFDQAGVVADIPRRMRVVESGTESALGLAAVGLAGLVIFPVWLRRCRHDARLRRLAVMLAVYHYGVVAFSAWDFQGYGDLFILLHSLGFFAAVALCTLYLRIVARAGPRPAVRAAVQAIAAAAIVVLVLRPWSYERSIAGVTRQAGTAMTLADQRAFAARLNEVIGGRRAILLGPSELLFLGDRRNPLPIVYWNAATHAYYRRSPEEERQQTLRRLLESSGVDLAICDRGSARFTPILSNYRFAGTESSDTGFAVDLYDLSAAR